MNTLLLTVALLTGLADPDTLSESVVITYLYDENGRLTSAATEGDVAFSYRYDAAGNPTQISISANQPPRAFIRLEPADNSSVATDSIRFAWSSAVDPEGEAVTYVLRLAVGGIDTTVTTSDTTVVLDISGRLLPPDELDARWSVSASDDMFTTASDEGAFVLDRTSHVASEEAGHIPRSYALLPNYPNPFNPTTIIRFDVPAAATVELAIFDMLGRRVATLIHGSLAPGRHEAEWNGRVSTGNEAPSGVYFYLLTAPDFRQARPMLLSR